MLCAFVLLLFIALMALFGRWVFAIYFWVDAVMIGFALNWFVLYCVCLGCCYAWFNLFMLYMLLDYCALVFA